MHKGLQENKSVTYTITLSDRIFCYFGGADSFAWSIEADLCMIEDIQVYYLYFVAVNLFIISIRSFIFYCV